MSKFEKIIDVSFLVSQIILCYYCAFMLIAATSVYDIFSIKWFILCFISFGFISGSFIIFIGLINKLKQKTKTKGQILKEKSQKILRKQISKHHLNEKKIYKNIIKQLKYKGEYELNEFAQFIIEDIKNEKGRANQYWMWSTEYNRIIDKLTKDGFVVEHKVIHSVCCEFKVKLEV